MIERESLTECCACASTNLETVRALPQLPQIGVYLKDRADEHKYPAIDNSLAYCHSCGHMQLGYAVNPKFLYSTEFQHKTSQSASAKQANEFLYRFALKHLPERRLKSVVEVGCNDTYLLHMFGGIADKLIGVDPTVSRENTSKFTFIQDFIENVTWDEAPDLIISNFVFEHIKSPREVLMKAFDKVSDNTLFVIGVPGTEFVIDNGRFDQLSHQHYQQFTMNSFRSMLSSIGATIAGSTVNYTNWGQIIVAFKRGGATRLEKPRYTYEDVWDSFDRFFFSLDLVKKNLSSDRQICGLGAAQNFPILNYFAGGFDFDTILDDHPLRQDTFYPGMHYQIAKPEGTYEGCACLITGPDYARVLVLRAAQLGFDQIITPFGVM